MNAPTVGDYMTSGPYSIGRDQTLTDAHRVMREHHIRHLPVLHGGRLIGLVSERDLHLIETLRDVNPAEVPVEEAMSQAPYTVVPEAPLEDVALEMWRHKYGSAVVMSEGRVCGVFTTTDALRALYEVISRGERASQARVPDAAEPMNL
jgi:acetoin utilization protein AcuB